MEKLEKINLKNQKGITLIALVVIIVVLLILAGITINMGTQSIKDSREDTLLSELGMVQNAILQRKTKADLTDEAYPGDKIDIATVNSVIAEINSQQTGEDIELKDNSEGKENNYYLLTTSNNGLNNLGITKSENEYIVNYETGEVINSTTKVTESGKPLYIYAKEVN